MDIYTEEVFYQFAEALLKLDPGHIGLIKIEWPHLRPEEIIYRLIPHMREHKLTVDETIRQVLIVASVRYLAKNE